MQLNMITFYWYFVKTDICSEVQVTPTMDEWNMRNGHSLIYLNVFKNNEIAYSLQHHGRPSDCVG